MSFSMNPVRKGKFSFTVSSQAITVASVGKTLVELPSATAGLTLLLDITGFSESIDFATVGGAGHPEFGITSTANWASAAPFFVYLINGTNASAGVKMIVSRNPVMTVAPAEGLFWYSDADADTDTQLSVAASWADGTNYAAKPVVCIGSFTMTYATATNTWTPVALTTADGFGKFQEGVEFNMPYGQNGAAAAGDSGNGNGTYFTLNAGTKAPGLWTTNNLYKYTINRQGRVHFSITFSGGDPNGNGAVDLQLSLPYTIAGTANLQHNGGMFVGATGGGITIRAWRPIMTVGNSYASFRQTSDNTQITQTLLDETNDTMFGSANYPAF